MVTVSEIVREAALAAWERVQPAIESAMRQWFRRKVSADRLEELTAEALALGWQATLRDVDQGEPIEQLVHDVAREARSRVARGQRLAQSRTGCDAIDRRAERRQCRPAEQLSAVIEDVAGCHALSPGRRSRTTPADEACFLIDYSEWKSSLTVRERAIVERLVNGDTGAIVARRLNRSSATVSVMRRKLRASWEAFIGGM